MRVSGARDIHARVVARRRDSAWPLRLFIGVHRFCLTIDEARDLATELVDAIAAARDGREFDGRRIPSIPDDETSSEVCRCRAAGGRSR